MGLKLKNNFSTFASEGTKSADQSAAERSVYGGSNNSLYQNGYTVLVSNDLYDNPLEIRGKQRVQKGFKALFFDSEFNFVDKGFVSPSSLTSNLYPNENDAVGAFSRVKGIEKYKTPRELADANLAGLVCVKNAAKKAACRPIWDDAAQTYTYKNMIKRDFTTFEIVSFPEDLKKKVFEE